MTAFPPEDNKPTAPAEPTPRAESMREPAFHIYIDVENVPGWVQKRGHQRLIDALSEMGPVQFRRAFADFTNHQKCIPALTVCGFSTVHVHHPNGGKDAADMALTAAAFVDTHRSRPGDTFVLVSSDSDFAPLLRGLTSLEMDVVVIGRPGCTLSAIARNAGYRFYDLDEFSGSSRISKPISATGNTPSSPESGGVHAGRARVPVRPKGTPRSHFRAYQGAISSLGATGITGCIYRAAFEVLEVSLDGLFTRDDAVSTLMRELPEASSKKLASRIVHLLTGAGGLYIEQHGSDTPDGEPRWLLAPDVTGENILERIDCVIVGALLKKDFEWCPRTAEPFLFGATSDEYIARLEQEARARIAEREALQAAE